MPTALLSCAHCSRPLPDAARRLGHGHCGQAACRQKADAAKLAQRWQGVLALAVDQATASLGTAAVRGVQTLWLQPVVRHTAPVTEGLRTALADAWRQALARGERREHRGPDTASSVPAAAAALCAHCGGGCCAHGARHHGFVDAEVLQRWLHAHPGQTAEQAVAHYLAQLPAAHVAGSCAFHASTGCTLPREQRSDTCNRYLCPTLATWRDALAEDTERAAVVVTRDGRRWEQVALAHRGRLQPLHGLPQPDELPRA